MKNTAIVTGASSGLAEINRVLVEMGYEVYGFGREFPGGGSLFSSDCMRSFEYAGAGAAD